MAKPFNTFGQNMHTSLPNADTQFLELWKKNPLTSGVLGGVVMFMPINSAVGLGLQLRALRRKT